MTSEAFIDKWAEVTTSERAAAHTHFLDLCELLEIDKPLDVDRKGEFYAFERRVSKVFRTTSCFGLTRLIVAPSGTPASCGHTSVISPGAVNMGIVSENQPE